MNTQRAKAILKLLHEFIHNQQSPSSQTMATSEKNAKVNGLLTSLFSQKPVGNVLKGYSKSKKVFYQLFNANHPIQSLFKQSNKINRRSNHRLQNLGYATVLNKTINQALRSNKTSSEQLKIIYTEIYTQICIKEEKYLNKYRVNKELPPLAMKKLSQPQKLKIIKKEAVNDQYYHLLKNLWQEAEPQFMKQAKSAHLGASVRDKDYLDNKRKSISLVTEELSLNVKSIHNESHSHQSPALNSTP